MFAVRVSAKELTSLILDEDRLRSERSDRKLWKSRVSGIDEHGPSAIAGPVERERPQNNRRKNPRTDEEDAEYRLAIEASKHEAEEEKKRRDKNKPAEDDDDLAKAIKLSKEEEELRKRELEDQNAASLFDDTPAPSQPQPTGWNQGYQQQGAVDWFGNPIQQPMTTGYLNNQYSQQPSQQQQTGYPNGFANGFGQQPTGFDQFQQQQQQPNYIQQQSTIQPQPTFTNNPYGQPQQQQPQQPSNDIFAQQPQQPGLQPGSHNPWATGNQDQAESQKPMPTGSNNPFAQRQQSVQQISSPSPLSTLYEQPQPAQFSQPTQPNPISNFQAPHPQPQLQSQSPQPTTANQKLMNPQHARLNALLASGDGQDTFGNTGDLRIPAQHTAPGTFVNSAGGGIDRLRAAQTGNNPFFQQQFTGAGPVQGGFGQQMPAQTGPVGAGGAFGQSSNNPFGPRPTQQQSGSLIDL